jgi:hypothetical protein
MKIYCLNNLLCLCLIKHHTIRIYTRLEAQTHTFLTPAPTGSELDVLAALVPGKGSRYLFDKGWRSYGMRLSLLPHLLYFFCPNSASVFWRIFVYIDIWLHRDCIWKNLFYKIILRVKHLNKSGACEVLTGYLSLGSRPGGDWANRWHWTKYFTIFCSKGRYRSSSTSKFSSLTLSSKKPLLEI